MNSNQDLFTRASTLSELFLQRLSLEKDIEDAHGEITEEQDLIWQNQELAIKDKIDTYGYVLTQMDLELDKLRALKREAVGRVQQAINRTESNKTRLKQRLNFLSEGSPLRGHIYSFHPYLSERRTVTDINLVQDDLVDLTIEINGSKWNEFLNVCAQKNIQVPEYKVVKRDVKVSSLPEDHPAVTTKRTASVRTS